MAKKLSSRLARLLEEFRKLDPTMQMQAALIFVLIAEAGDQGIQQQDLVHSLGMAASTISRNIAKMGKRGRLEAPGLELVEEFYDSMDNRRQLLKATGKGRRVYQSLSDIMER